jgi:RNA polymerase sigma-70 factor (ECF subfamily)
MMPFSFSREPAMQSKTASAGQGRRDMEDQDDNVLVGLARQGDDFAIRTLVRRHNQRLFRVARSVLRNDGEAEDVVQASYVKAFTHLDGFRGEAQLSTWLTRITLNEALGRLRQRRPTTDLGQIDIEQSRNGGQIIQFPSMQMSLDPETEMSRVEIRQILEQAVDGLPAAFRSVFVMRDVEGMSIEETAAHLAIKPETVKTRLFRARRLMRTAIEEQMNGALSSLFPFDGARCVGMADRVLAELDAQAGRPGRPATH